MLPFRLYTHQREQGQTYITYFGSALHAGRSGCNLVRNPTEMVNEGQLHPLWEAQMLGQRSPPAKTSRSHSHRVRD